MRISDLPHHVSGVRGNWSPEFPTRVANKDGWVGFTPPSDDTQSRLNLRDTIRKQVGKGYVLEYVHLYARPNQNGRPFTQEEKALREEAAGALTAVYKLADQSVHANKLVSAREFEEIQDRWDQRGDRLRWSEAFLIVEAWEIAGRPKARDILGPEAAKRTCETQSQYLKPLTDDDRAKLAPLELNPIDLPADGLAAQHFVAEAQTWNNAKGIRTDKLAPEDTGLYEDFQAIEGATKETRLRLAQRDRHLAITLKRIGPLKCQICCYDPKQHGANDRQAHAIIEVHHKKPLLAGKRLSTLQDLLLLCPTCHREVHQGITQISHGA